MHHIDDVITFRSSCHCNLHESQWQSWNMTDRLFMQQAWTGAMTDVTYDVQMDGEITGILCR